MPRIHFDDSRLACHFCTDSQMLAAKLAVFLACLPFLCQALQIPFQPQSPAGQSWECIGPIQAGTREETVLPDVDALFQRARTPSAVVVDGWTSLKTFGEDEEGQVTIVYPDARCA